MRKSLEELQQAVKLDDIYHFKLRDSKTTEEKPKKGRNVPPAPVNMKMISLKERGLCLELCKRTSCHQAQLFECQLQRGRSDIEYFFHCQFLERTVHIDKGCSQRKYKVVPDHCSSGRHCRRIQVITILVNSLRMLKACLQPFATESKGSIVLIKL